MNKQKGDEAEDLACMYLLENHFKILQRNFYAKKIGEIDIIALKNSTYHFVEVKSAQDYESAINNLTKAKISKLKRSIDYYLQKNSIETAFCIDAIIVVNKDIEYLENITI